MFTRIRKHVTGTNVAVMIALVFAMSGGAYAAKKIIVITSIKQIKSSVVAQLKGKVGPAGKNGAQGPAGLAGKDGIQGPQGEKGQDGSNGSAGATGPAGAKGATGPAGTTGPKGATGSPWTPDNVLPVGATETGQWAIFGTAAKTGELKVSTISFPIPLSASPAITIVKIGESVPSSCAGGSAASPKATEGNLCVFEGEPALSFGNLEFVGSIDGSGALGASATGVDLLFESSATGEVSAAGSWAVTGK